MHSMGGVLLSGQLQIGAGRVQRRAPTLDSPPCRRADIFTCSAESFYQLTGATTSPNCFSSRSV